MSEQSVPASSRDKGGKRGSVCVCVSSIVFLLCSFILSYFCVCVRSKPNTHTLMAKLLIIRCLYGLLVAFLFLSFSRSFCIHGARKHPSIPTEICLCFL